MVEITDVIEKLPRKPGHPYWKTRPLGGIGKIVVHYDAVKIPPATECGEIAYEPVQRYIAQAQYHINKNWNEGKRPVVKGFGLMCHAVNNAPRCIRWPRLGVLALSSQESSTRTEVPSSRCLA